MRGGGKRDGGGQGGWVGRNLYAAVTVSMHAYLSAYPLACQCKSHTYSQAHIC